MSNISLSFTIGDIKSFIEQGLSYKEISSQMKHLHPSAGGLSKIRRFCKEPNINKNCTMSEESKRKQFKQGSRKYYFFLSRSHSGSSVRNCSSSFQKKSLKLKSVFRLNIFCICKNSFPL